MVLLEKSKTVSFASSIMKNIGVYLSHSRFPVKLIWCIAFGSISSFCCLLRYISQFFECYHMFLNQFLLAEEKKFFYRS